MYQKSPNGRITSTYPHLAQLLPTKLLGLLCHAVQHRLAGLIDLGAVLARPHDRVEPLMASQLAQAFLLLPTEVEDGGLQNLVWGDVPQYRWLVVHD